MKKRKWIGRLVAIALTASMVPFHAFPTWAQTVPQVKEIAEEDILAQFTFDDETSGFTSANAEAVSNGTTALSDDAAKGKAARFTGSNWLNVVDGEGGSLLAGQTELTITYYSKPSSSGNKGWTVYAAPNTDAPKYGESEHYVGVMDTTAQVKIERFDNTTTRPGNDVTGTSGTDWKHVVITLDDTTTTLYVDGVKSTGTSTFTLEDILETSPVLQIGKANWDGGEYFAGLIDELTIYNRVLTEQEIAQMRPLESIAVTTAPDKTAYAPGADLDLTGMVLTGTYTDGTKSTFTDTSTFEVSGYDSSKTGTQTVTVSYLGKTATFTVEVLTDAKIAEEVKKTLTIINADAVKGNITLPSKDNAYGADITWKSSNTAVITDTAVVNQNYDDMPAGVVTRQATDVVVNMTATIKVGASTATKVIPVTVKAKPAEKTLSSYLFAYFPDNSNEQIYFATGTDAFNYKDLNDGQPVLKSDIGDQGVRDPYLFRSVEGDRFFLIATDLKVDTTGWDKAQYGGSLNLVIWESEDLVNWSEPRLVDVGMTGYEDVGCVWAPEAIYDELTGEYVVFWASMTGKKGASGTHQVMYYSKTRDFVNFTPAEVFINREDGRHCIDTTIVECKGSYYRISADTKMTIEKSDTILGEWEEISTLTELHKSMNGYDKFYADTRLNLTGGVVEGPEFFKLNDGERDEDTWGLFLDNYGGVGYVPVTTTDIGDTTGDAWQLYTKDQYNFGSLMKRHGSVLGITEEEYNAVMAKWDPAVEKVTSDNITIVTSKAESGVATLYVSKNNTDEEQLKEAQLTFDLVDDAEIIEGEQDTYDLTQDVKLLVAYGDDIQEWTVKVVMANNPVLGGQFADPDIDCFDGTYYIYPTTDGFSGWSGYQFHVFSSPDLVNWTDEGLIVDVKADTEDDITDVNESGIQIAHVPWADGSAWAPTIEEKDGKYYFYFCAKESSGVSAIGVAVADTPVGPFVAEEEPLVTMSICKSEGISMGQAIDPSIFTEEDGTSYMLFGNGNGAIVELGEDMVSLVPGTMKNIAGATDLREAITVTKRNGVYHFTWSCDDTGSENYHVKYGTSDNLYGPITYKKVVLSKDKENDMLGTAHHSILQVPGKDEFYIAYHRFVTPLGQYTSGFGYHRETCINKVEFNAITGEMEVITPTLEGITEPVYPAGYEPTAKVVYTASTGGKIQGVAAQTVIIGENSATVTAVPDAGYVFSHWSDGLKTAARTDKITEEKTFTAYFTKQAVVTPVTPTEPTAPVATVKSISLNKKTITLGVGEKFQLKATVLPTGISTKLSWKSANNKKVKVSTSGKITAKKTGTVNVTVTAANGVKATCKVIVKKAPKKITLKKKAVTLKKGKTHKIVIKFPKGTASNKITYTTSKKSVAKVVNGKVKALKKGNAVITVKTFNGKTAKLKVKVK